jgi:4-carboxymuconolactone decarboxylase
MKIAAIVAVAILAAVPATPRVQPLPETQWTDVHRDLVKTFATDGPVPNDLRTLLVYPELVKDLMPFERYISSESTLSPRHREMLILRTAWLCRSGYEWARHAGIARKAGLSNDDLKRIARGANERGWDPFEKALLQAADELHVSSFVSDPTWAVLAARYNTQQMIDVVFTMAEFTMVSGIVNSLGIQIESGVADRMPTDVPYQVTAVKSDERLIGKKARVLPIEPADWTPEVRKWLDPRGSGRSVAAIYRTYAHHLKMDIPRTAVSEHIRGRSTLSPVIRELLIMRIGWLCRSEYEWAAHAPAGRRAGMTEADVQHIMAGPGSGADAATDALLRAVDELYRDDVISDATWNALASRFDTRQMLDVLTTTGGYRMVSTALNTLGVQLEPGAVRFPASASGTP